MKRTLVLGLSVLLLSGRVAAQNAHEGAVKFMKDQQNAVMADFDLDKDVVKDALRERLEKEGLGKSHSDKGFINYKAATWTAVSPDKVDVYFRVDGKDNKSTVTMLVSKGYDNFITSAKDPEVVQRVEAFLNSFLNDAHAYQLRQNIAAQEEVVRHMQKDYDGSVSDGGDLAKSKEKIEKQMAENKADQEKRQTALSTEKAKLDDMKKQIK